MTGEDRYKGMPLSREDWLKTDVAKASTIACSKCGERFAAPHDFYDHLDTVHKFQGKGKERKR